MARRLISPIAIGPMATACGLTCSSPGLLVERVGASHELTAGVLGFVRSGVDPPSSLHGSVVVCTSEASAAFASRGAATIAAPNPRLAFAMILQAISRKIGFKWSSSEPEVHPTAVIGKNTVIELGARIGASTIIGNNVVIGREAQIGSNCYIKSGAIVGEDGFGFERTEHGLPIRFAHLGGVIVGDDVEIGSLTTICRGALGDTIIERNVKIDDHCHIAHNVFIGEASLIIACAEISGGVTVGQRVWVSPSASIRNKVRIGSDALVGIGAVVIADVEERAIVAGVPARPLRRKGC
jgi:UDP-3-O-[3-hydroxymyristoyl] glucosamine N-acyltransferase